MSIRPAAAGKLTGQTIEGADLPYLCAILGFPCIRPKVYFALLGNCNVKMGEVGSDITQRRSLAWPGEEPLFTGSYVVESEIPFRVGGGAVVVPGVLVES